MLALKVPTGQGSHEAALALAAYLPRVIMREGQMVGSHGLRVRSHGRSARAEGAVKAHHRAVKVRVGARLTRLACGRLAVALRVANGAFDARRTSEEALKPRSARLALRLQRAASVMRLALKRLVRHEGALRVQWLRYAGLARAKARRRARAMVKHVQILPPAAVGDEGVHIAVLIYVTPGDALSQRRGACDRAVSEGAHVEATGPIISV